MYELSRVRLHSVGPKGARYQDVTLDLRGMGRPVPPPEQPSLLSDPLNQRRPSPATVLFTENGSGKSVLMKLIFSVMLPGRRQIVGTTSSRVLENFVLDTDVAHVVLEWQHTGTGERIVTGKVAAWRGHVVSSDPNRLTEAWYSFHPSPSYGLDELPLTEEGRLVSLPGFRERLAAAAREHPALQLVWETLHGAWTEHLESLDLDPTLFVYQRRMNAGEGEAADAFSFASDEAFVDWLLRSVTDEEDPRDLAEVLDGYATTLARRSSLDLEREFVEGALERLSALRQAADEAGAAAQQMVDAEQGVARLGAGIRLRHAQEISRLAMLSEQRTELEQAAKSASEGVRDRDAAVARLERQVAALRLAEAEQARDELASGRDAARGHLAAWRATGAVVRLRGAAQAADSLRRFVDEKEADAAPILAERERAAQRLVQGLIALAAEADRRAAAASAEATGLDGRIGVQQAEEREHAVLAERRRGAAEAARRQVATARAAVGDLVDAGLLGPDDDVRAAADRARDFAAAGVREVHDAEGEQRRLATDRRAADAAIRAAEATARDTGHAARTAWERLDQAQRATSAIAQEERLPALLGVDLEVDAVDLEVDADALLRRLDRAVAEAESERTQLHLAAVTDRKVVDALGTGGLLPPPADVLAVVTALQEAGIACRAGWDHLARLPEAEREPALRAHPELIGGVLLTDADQVDRARSVLAAARLLPRSVVAFGVLGSPGGNSEVVTPHPAMYDESLAAAERDSLLAVQRDRDLRLLELDRALGHDRRLGDRIERWLRDYPAGALAQLTEASDAAEQAAAVADSAVAAAVEGADGIAAAEADLAERLPGLREDAQERARRAEQIGRIAEGAARLAEWTAAASDATAEAELADRTATAALAEAARLRQVRDETIRGGDDQRRIAASVRAEIAGIAGGGSAGAGEPPAEPVETLRAAHRSAVDAYARVEVGQDLRSQLDAAERSESDARAAVERLRADERTGVEALLATPDAADEVARAAATERAERALAQSESQVGQAEGRVGGLRHAYEQLAPLPPAPPGEDVPGDIATAEARLTAAEQARATARTNLDELTRRAAGVADQLASASATAQGFDSVAVSMGDLPEEEDESPPAVDASAFAFAGSVEDSRERAREVRQQRAAARTRLSELAAQVRRSASALHRYAADERFERADSPVRKQMLAVDVDALPGHAHEWEAALRPRLRTLTDDLAHIGRHRAQLTTRLRGMVTTALTVLQAAERVSILPDSLGDWAGQKFLRIRFAEPDRATLDDRLGEVIDEFAALAGKEKGRRDGMSLLLRGVRAAMPRGVRVEMLKPDASERAERVRIADVANVFSGGQLLTAAIILYCTMAALRANERGQTRRPHAGVLFLDNPIGRASAGYLLELQLGVADALGVQLIYTTGLFDVNALSVFPLILRLRNDRDLRSGLRFLTVDDEIRRHLDALGAPDGAGQLTAARLFRKPS